MPDSHVGEEIETAWLHICDQNSVFFHGLAFHLLVSHENGVRSAYLGRNSGGKD